MKKKKSSKQNKIYLVVVVALGLSFGGWYWYSATVAAEPVVKNQTDPINNVYPDDITKGNPQAKAVLIEYADFQCIACKQAHERFELIWRVLQDDLLMVYRHYPLEQHAHSRMASRYSEAMHRQGKFWPFHDLLYKTQHDWEFLSSDDARKKFEEYVVSAGGDLEQVNKDLQDSAIDKKIDRDMDFGYRSGLRGTPTLILNGRQILVPNDLAKFVSEIKSMNQP